MTAYQLDPDFQVGQDVLQDEPLTVPETVIEFARPRDVLIDALVEGPVRRFTLEHAGAIACDEAVIGATANRTSITAARDAVTQRPRGTRSVGFCGAAGRWSTGSPIVPAPTRPGHDPTGPLASPPDGPGPAGPEVAPWHSLSGRGNHVDGGPEQVLCACLVEELNTHEPVPAVGCPIGPRRGPDDLQPDARGVFLALAQVEHRVGEG